MPTIVRLFGGGDDHVLRNVVRFFEMQGFTVRGVAEVAPEMLVSSGALARIAPGPAYASDAAKGFSLIKALGGADVGQAVVIQGGKTVAIEAAEGTDRMLQRLATRGKVAGGVLVKGPKPGQELRVDMPVIGPRTLELAAELGLAGIAVSSGGVLVADRKAVIERADAHGLFVAGVEQQAREGDAARSSTVAFLRCSLAPLTRVKPSQVVRRDMARGIAVLSALDAVAASVGVVVVRRHVIAIETGEGVSEVCARTKLLRQWGATAHSKRRGALVLNMHMLDSVACIQAIESAAEAGLAGIAVTAGGAQSVIDAGIDAASRLGLAMAESNGNWP